ncbi:hypothetical protein [Microvirga arsenatis]|uniref:Uncharacterized protein n=1 Tax=Microvirga arsenatis TaxID=2692265 RepID=A0ABW9Z051_9HYPH|nr:hypothetical protein [Microvirga arsenatis]NBJ11043.1 hypothetical protein [Microvirga arsenatis]NBJ25316.1 hypothetical protein [Microvirga arsenatis]
MGIRFDKVLEQVARAGQTGGDVVALESRERKIQRIEELIRAREATGDRIVICLGLALTLSAIGLPVYALHFSESHIYLQGAGDIVGSRGVLAAQTRSAELSPATTGSLKKSSGAGDLAPGSSAEASAASSGARTQFQNYVIHRATGQSALIEGPEGLWWVTPGMTLPGIGQIISIERSDSGWVVLTSETMITQPPAPGPSS